MKFRLPEWDIAMPASLGSYWSAWNESEVARIRDHLRAAVRSDVVWNDPRDSFVGIDALEHAVRTLRSSKPEFRFRIASEIDHHHARLRYRWIMHRNGRILMQGLDIVTLDDTGLIERIDGFFGEPTPIDPQTTLLPPQFLE